MKQSPEVLGHLNWCQQLVPVTAAAGCEKHVDQVLTSEPVLGWARRLEPQFDLQNIHLQSVDMFGPRVGFVKLTATMADGTGGHRPCICFLRGGAVAVLVILERISDGKEFVVLTLQPRGPSGNFQLAEIPAGMIDGDGNLAGVAARELREETGIVVNETDLTDLTDFAYDGRHPGFFPSAGGCDEFIRLYSMRSVASAELLQKLQGRIGGVAEEGESIRLACVPLDEVWRHAPDSKALAALYLYDKWNQSQNTRKRMSDDSTSTRIYRNKSH